MEPSVFSQSDSQQAQWQTRAHILRMAELGMTDKEISFLLGIEVTVLLALYADEIKAAILKIKLAALNALESLVKAGKPSAVLFWLRHRFPKEKEPAFVPTPFHPDMFQVLNHLGERIG